MKVRERNAPEDQPLMDAVFFLGVSDEGDPMFHGDIPDWLVTMLGNAQGHPDAAWVEFDSPINRFVIGRGLDTPNTVVEPHRILVRRHSGAVDVMEAIPFLIEFEMMVEIEREAEIASEAPADFLSRVGMDGAKWAKEFMAMKFTHEQIDEGLMIGWFCNAIMAGYDEARRRYEGTPEQQLDGHKVFVYGKGMVEADQAE